MPSETLPSDGEMQSQQRERTAGEELFGLDMRGFETWAVQLGMTLREFNEVFADCPGTVEHVRRTMERFVPETLAGELALQMGVNHHPNQFLVEQYPMIGQTSVDAESPGRTFFGPTTLHGAEQHM